MSLSEPVTQTARHWSGPDFAEEQRRTLQAKEDAKLISPERLLAIQTEAFNKGYAEGKNQGFAKGLADGRALVESRVNLFTQLADALQQPLNLLDEEVEAELLRLVTLVARQLVRRELNASPGEVMAVIREATALLPMNARDVRIRLNPSDAVLVRSLMQMPDEETTWQIQEDPLVTPGGCQVLANESRIDASVESRLNGAITALLGDERSQPV